MKNLLGALLLLSASALAQNRDLLVGTYTGGNSKGIYVYQFNAETGALTMRSVTENVEQPSFLAVAPGKKYVYATNETGGDNPGSISSFTYDAASGKLTLINKEKSSGDHPCYIAAESSGRFVVTGNYSGGNLTVNPVQDGRILPAVQVLQHEGKSVTDRQEAAHVHATIFSPDEKYLLVPDLGMDEVWIYPFNASLPKPVDEQKAVRVKTSPGAGPRHLCFGDKGRFVYLIEELSGMVTAFRFSNGNMKPIQTISAHPGNYLGKIGSADIHLSPDGKFLYTTNRGNSNTIAIFKVDGSSGKLKLKDIIPTRGETPRNFTIDPTGNFLLVANQDSENIVVFRRNRSNGSLTYTGQQAKVGKPVCLVFPD